MKNERTPRTLSECQWVTGYPSIPWHDKHVYRARISGNAWAVVVSLVMFAAIGVFLAWRG